MVVKTVDIFLARSRNILSILSIWLPPTKYVIFCYIIRSVVFFSQYSFLVLELIYIMLVWGDLNEVSEASHLLFTQTAVCYKMTVFIINKTNLIALLKFMETDIFESRNDVHDKILITKADKVKNLCGIFLINALIACTLWTITPWFESSEAREFPFKIWMPLDSKKSVEFELGYLYQVIAIYVSALLFFSVDSISLSMIMFGCAQIEIIINKMQKIQNISMTTKTKSNEYKKIINDNNKLFDDCIRQHQAVIRFIELLENTYHANIFFQLTGTVIIICIIGLCITIAKPSSIQFFSMVFYMVTMTSQLLLYCWCGSELTTKSEDLRECLYQCVWYEQDVKFRRSLLIAMESMKRPIIFKAGHYIPLSRPTFVLILRTSYSYFAVLNQANNK
ncbi:odorant receptor Or1-like [Melitaea cinxia]|uniref:odorant receptor Or1-like n=1 Tax=Melitaea cinxia TaxID=113334 RepID=UPI001E271EEE|nr:odorant receptor Or1-like [Melitaea cinxia]